MGGDARHEPLLRLQPQRHGGGLRLDSRPCSAISSTACRRTATCCSMSGRRRTGPFRRPQAARLKAFGAWLGANGAAIYGTRPWTRAEGVTDDGLPVRFTAEPGRLNLIVLGSPTGERLRVLGSGRRAARPSCSPTKPGDVSQDGPDLVLTFARPLDGHVRAGNFDRLRTDAQTLPGKILGRCPCERDDSRGKPALITAAGQGMAGRRRRGSSTRARRGRHGYRRGRAGGFGAPDPRLDVTDAAAIRT